ncbi:MAG TPA: GyrI-like domain-containing protein [Magnetospirillum sp.]|jgi:AraC family transcriptional regulator|nr:GyrI-like domain-containing protein [Magnetospirillum sp.]
MSEVTVLTLPPLALAGLFHRGPYEQLGDAFAELVQWAEANNAFRPDTRVFSIGYDNPALVAAQDLRAHACMTLPAGMVPNGVVEPVSLAGGRYATLVHRGPYSELGQAHAWLNGQWLPASGERRGEGPCSEEYLNDCRVLPPEQWLTRIHLPLAGA